MGVVAAVVGELAVGPPRSNETVSGFSHYCKLQVTSYMLQVTSYKLQVTSYKLQVTSYKLQVTSYKLQVTSYMLQVTSYSCTPQKL
jgi:hypothetical protein